MIPLSEPRIGAHEWKYVKECIDTGWVSYLGSYVTAFEKAVAAYTGSAHAAAVVNGTAALHISLKASGIGAQEEVLVPALTFVAPANTVRYCGAEPVFIDCDPLTLGIDPAQCADFVKRACVRKRDGSVYNRKTKKRIAALIPVHVFGHPADMEPLVSFCREHRITLIEDATESIGSTYRGKQTGTFGACGCFSFNGNKIITAGGGGMVVSDDESLIRRIRHLTTQAKKPGIEYDHDAIGYNYRLSNLQAALGLAQLEQLDEFIRIKRRNLALYRELLEGIPQVCLYGQMPWARSNFWFYTLKVKKQHKNPLIRFLTRKQIQVRPIWKLMVDLPAYRRAQRHRIRVAREAYDTCINIPCSVGLSREQIHTVAVTIKEYFSQ